MFKRHNFSFEDKQSPFLVCVALFAVLKQLGQYFKTIPCIQTTTAAKYVFDYRLGNTHLSHLGGGCQVAADQSLGLYDTHLESGLQPPGNY